MINSSIYEKVIASQAPVGFEIKTQRGQYVLRKATQASESEKNDIKLHVGIGDISQIGIAMNGIHEVISKYQDLVYEYKVVDVMFAKEKIESSKNEIAKILKTLENARLPNNVIEKIKNGKSDELDLNDLTDEQKIQVRKAISDIQNQNGISHSYERALSQVPFTIYFNEGANKKRLKSFCNELNEVLLNKGVMPASSIAETDKQVNSYCGITIDNITRDEFNRLRDENNKNHDALNFKLTELELDKIALDSGIPSHVELRQKLLEENPVIKYITSFKKESTLGKFNSILPYFRLSSANTKKSPREKPSLVEKLYKKFKNKKVKNIETKEPRIKLDEAIWEQYLTLENEISNLRDRLERHDEKYPKNISDDNWKKMEPWDKNPANNAMKQWHIQSVAFTDKLNETTTLKEKLINDNPNLKPAIELHEKISQVRDEVELTRFSSKHVDKLNSLSAKLENMIEKKQAPKRKL